VNCRIFVDYSVKKPGLAKSFGKSADFSYFKVNIVEERSL